MSCPDVTRTPLTPLPQGGWKTPSGAVLVGQDPEGWHVTTALDRFDAHSAGLWTDQEVRSRFLGRLLRPRDGVIQPDEVTPLKDQQHVEAGWFGNLAFYGVTDAHVVLDAAHPILEQHWEAFHLTAGI